MSHLSSMSIKISLNAYNFLTETLSNNEFQGIEDAGDKIGGGIGHVLYQISPVFLMISCAFGLMLFTTHKRSVEGKERVEKVCIALALICLSAWIVIQITNIVIGLR